MNPDSSGRSLPEGIALPHRIQEFSGAELLTRFVSAQSGESFSEIHEDSPVVCTWRCPAGHQYQQPRAAHRRSRGCPVCAGSVATRMPGLLRFWDESKNTRSPVDVSAYDRERFFWRCEHGHSFERAPYRVLATGHRCQQCRREGNTAWKIAGKRDGSLTLARAHPDLVSEWDYAKNARGPEEFSPGSQREAFWICANGHSWSSPICHRTSPARHQASCQHCKAIAFSAPELAAELHPRLNPPGTAERVRKGSSELLHWECELGHVYQASVVARLRGTYPASCDKCRSIAVKAPDLIAACWARELNDHLDPAELGVSSAEEAHWVKPQFLDVPAEQRRAEHYERMRVGYRYRRYLKHRVREDRAIQAWLCERQMSERRSASG